jgi:hypothetical protein
MLKVSSLHTEQTGLVQATHDTALRKAVQVGAARRETAPALRTKQGRTCRRCGVSFPVLDVGGMFR